MIKYIYEYDNARYSCNIKVRTQTLGITLRSMSCIPDIRSNTISGCVANLTILYLNGDYR